MLEDETALIITNKQKQMKFFNSQQVGSTYLRGMNMRQPQTIDQLLQRQQNLRPKSNFGNQKYMPNGVMYTDITQE